MTEPAERILNGRYRITSLIGRGGMADVYLGHDLTLDRKVAVKMLRPDLARDPQFQGRFRREGQSSASLNHPNIVAVYDSGRAEVEDHAHHEVKTPYIVMEYVDGVTLRHILHGTPKITDTSDVDGEETRVSSASSTTPPPPPGAADEDVLSLGDTGRVHADGEHIPAQQVGSQLQYKIDHALNTPLSERETAGYMHGILGALGYSHDKGIVHRDIKPSNVMVSQTGQIKVMDFGIARALADSASTMTQTSAVVGTAQYLSPEQARGEVVDHRSDLYSAGCVLFELLTNRPPFQGESPVSVAYQHVREAPPLVSDFNNQVSPAMESVVGKALTKDPARRFQTAEEFNQAIQKALIGIGVDEDDHPTAALGAVGGRQDFNQVLAAGAAPIGTRLSARTPEDPDLYENHEVPERRPRRRRGGLVLIWTLLILGLLGGGAYVLMNMLDTPESSIPEVEDLERAEAIEALDDANVSYSIETEPSTDIEEDHATRTDPGAGTVVTPEDSVVLYLSSGPDSVRVPTDLEDLSEDEAREALEEAGLEVGDVSEENDSSVEEGLVISTDPESGTSVSPGSEVNLVLSTGLVDMPGVFNRSLSDARSILENAGLSVNTIEDERTDYAAGTVVGQRLNGQSIRAGDPIPQGSQVTLVVAVAPPAPDPEPEDEESESDPPENESPDSEGEGEDNTEDEAGNADDGGGGDNADSENSDSANGDSSNGNDDGNNGGNSNNGGGNGNSNGGNGGENANDAANGNNAP